LTMPAVTCGGWQQAGVYHSSCMVL
jgi:hypothetical protein